jgi:hypothetical protein|tara:strand:+ start:124 stop:258 length:135 start_codon:yes stop_codon:yes gene_type:complete
MPLHIPVEIIIEKSNIKSRTEKFFFERSKEIGEKYLEGLPIVRF